jgi:hypothetical protein
MRCEVLWIFSEPTRAPPQTRSISFEFNSRSVTLVVELSVMISLLWRAFE